MQMFSTNAMRRGAAFALILILAAGHVAHAQTTTATLSGTITDRSGAAIADADVTVTNEATGLKRQTRSNEEGRFVLPLLQPGAYSLHAEREGFSTAAIDHIELPVAGQVSQDITLELGAIRETASVSERAPLLQPDTSRWRTLWSTSRSICFR